MSILYAHSEDHGSIASKGALAFLSTAAIFSLLPILQIIPNPWTDGPGTNPIKTVADIAPVVIEPVIEDPIQKPELEKPVLEKEPPKLTLLQIETLLNPGTGGVGTSSLSYNLGGFIDSGTEIVIFELDALDRPPRALFQNQPSYPYALKQAKIEGWVVIEWVITDTGRVTNPRIINSSHRDFQRPTIESILSSKWKAGEIAGKAVNSRVRQKITFSL